MTALRAALQQYLTLRRALGFTLRLHETGLTSFGAYLDYVGATTVTTELAVTWATLPPSAHPDTWKRRLRVVRGFARYLQALALDTEGPGTDVLAVATNDRCRLSTPRMKSAR